MWQFLTERGPGIAIWCIAMAAQMSGYTNTAIALGLIGLAVFVLVAPAIHHAHAWHKRRKEAGLRSVDHAHLLFIGLGGIILFAGIALAGVILQPRGKPLTGQEASAPQPTSPQSQTAHPDPFYSRADIERVLEAMYETNRLLQEKAVPARDDAELFLSEWDQILLRDGEPAFRVRLNQVRLKVEAAVNGAWAISNKNPHYVSDIAPVLGGVAFAEKFFAASDKFAEAGQNLPPTIDTRTLTFLKPMRDEYQVGVEGLKKWMAETYDKARATTEHFRVMPQKTELPQTPRSQSAEVEIATPYLESAVIHPDPKNGPTYVGVPFRRGYDAKVFVEYQEYLTDTHKWSLARRVLISEAEKFEPGPFSAVRTALLSRHTSNSSPCWRWNSLQRSAEDDLVRGRSYRGRVIFVVEGAPEEPCWFRTERWDPSTPDEPPRFIDYASFFGFIDEWHDRDARRGLAPTPAALDPTEKERAKQSIDNSTHVTSNYQSGGITAGSVHINPKIQRVLGQSMRQKILQNVPRDKLVVIWATHGDEESYKYASEIFQFMKSEGYNLFGNGPSNQIFLMPAYDFTMVPGKDKTELIVGILSETAKAAMRPGDIEHG
jgi:hypothetical protein